MEQTVWSEMSAYKTQTPQNYPEESIQHFEHGGSLKSRICMTLFANGQHIFTYKEMLCDFVPNHSIMSLLPRDFFSVSLNVNIILAVLVWQLFGSYIFDLFCDLLFYTSVI
jgi:hypothetical protein